MNSKLRLVIALLIVVLCAAACGGTSVSPTSQPAGQPAGGVGQADVTITSLKFEPAQLSVSAGATVKWTNQDNVAHTVTSDSGDWDSGSLSQGQSFSHTFTQAGTFAYHCTVHPTMKGTITVTP